MPFATAASWVTRACRRPPTASSSPSVPSSPRKPRKRALRYAYLQFDGIGNEANSHRAVGNLFDVKLRAIENLYSAGVDIVPVITIINGINNEQVGAVVRFALDNPKKIPFLSFQPVSFTGRDEAITDDRRKAQRYTLSHLAHDVKNQTGLGEPTRDWFPISFMSTFSDFADLVHGPDAQWGQLSCGCHPNCGTGMAIMCDKETKEYVPVTAFLNADRLAKDIARINDAARSKRLSVIGVSLALLRNYNPYKAPTHFRLTDLIAKFDKCFGMTGKELRQGHRRPHHGGHPEAPRATAGTSCSSPACGSRICSITISAAPSSASFRTPRRKARFPSARTIPASAGATSSRRCT